ncbi:MAG: hypothetical protein JXR97_16365 [Planctomycetes bacterium]|nr:hypothetical protein [Planctomycetota bacterium]
MLTGLLLALLTGICFATGAGLFATVARTRLPFLTFLSIGAGVGLVLTLIFIVDWSSIGKATRISELCLWICAGAIANVAGHRAIAGAMAESRAPISWAISQGGQAIPFIASAIIWNERSGPMPWLGIAVLLSGVAVLALSRKGDESSGSSRRGVALALLAFLCYGINNLLMSVPSHWDNWEDSSHLRVPLTLAVFSLGGVFFSSGWSGPVVKRILPMALGYGLLLTICFGCVYAALDYLGNAECAGIFWPLASGTGIAAYAVWERCTSRRAMAPTHLIGLVMVIAGIVALAARGLA